MTKEFGFPGEYSLDNHGLKNLNDIYWTLPTANLIEKIIARGEGKLTIDGGVSVLTGEHTGRSAGDKFIVKEGATENDIWWGDINHSIDNAEFENLYSKIKDYMESRDVFVQDTTVGSHPDYNMPIRIITTNAWHNLFSRIMFLPLENGDLKDHKPEFTVLHAPEVEADPDKDGTKTKTFIVISFEKRLVLIGGTIYAGEIKKSIFTILNFMLTENKVLPMHCSANVSKDGETALFFGLSGTGKTTLSSDLERPLVGDDEHGWGEDGVFNFEGGCYAKAIHLDPNLEPLIYAASLKFGTLFENVVLDPVTRKIDYDDDRYTENTRLSYPTSFLPNSLSSGRAGHPKYVFFLSADAFGVLPPISKLTKEQALYYFLSGYTSKLGGTEKGLGKEPLATFSACFGAPFLPRHPNVYAELLGEKISQNNPAVWLVNTGWTGGPYGVGSRIKLEYTRAMVSAALSGELDSGTFVIEDTFGLNVPTNIPGVPDEVLKPKNTWGDKNEYDRIAANLIERFHKNFDQYKDKVSDNILTAGP